MVGCHCQGKQSCEPENEVRTNSTAIPTSEESLEGSQIPTRPTAYVLTYDFWFNLLSSSRTAIQDQLIFFSNLGKGLRGLDPPEFSLEPDKKR